MRIKKVDSRSIILHEENEVKLKKEARCEKGDGYYYDVEADRLMKLKFIKTEE